MVGKPSGLQVTIGYILIIGVALSLIAESAGIITYAVDAGSLSVTFAPEFQLRSRDFFAYTYRVVAGIGRGFLSYWLMAFGIVALLLTPYARVVASVLYFAYAKNPKYVGATLFVLVVLTVSLLVH